MEFVAADMPHANKLTVHILAAMAEHEAEAISVRTKLALAAAKARGRKLGGDRGNLPAVAKAGTKASAVIRGASADARARDISGTIAELRAQGAFHCALLPRVSTGVTSRHREAALGQRPR